MVLVDTVFFAIEHPVNSPFKVTTLHDEVIVKEALGFPCDASKPQIRRWTRNRSFEGHGLAWKINSAQYYIAEGVASSPRRVQLHRIQILNHNIPTFHWMSWLLQPMGHVTIDAIGKERAWQAK